MAVPTIQSQDLPASAAALRERLAEVIAEIKYFEAKLQPLCIAREEVVDALKSITYPVSTLPPEITTQFFIHYVTLAPDDHSPIQDPFVLASVCREWRNLALSIPELWFRISAISMAGPRIAASMARASTHLLELDISRSDNPAAIFPVLVPSSAQWKFFRCNISEPLQFPVNDIHGRIPHLQTLVLNNLPINVGADGRLTPSTPHTAFSEAPLLREVHLNGLSMEWVSLPWSQLTTLSCDCLNKAQILEILQQTPNLENLKFSLFRSWEGLQAAPISLIQLDRLYTIRFELNPDTESILDFLVLPALAHLALQAPEGLSPFNLVQHLKSLLVRSNCTLLSLTLSDFTSFAAVNIFKITPSITKLFLPGLRWEHQDVLFLAINRDNVLPNLTTLAIEPPAALIPYSGITQLLTARGSGASSVERTEQVLAPLKELVFTAPYDMLGEERYTQSLRCASHQLGDIASQLASAGEGGCKFRITCPPNFNANSERVTDYRHSYTLDDDD